VQEVDATARALREQAERLDELVARFVIDGDATRPRDDRTPRARRLSAAA
jgi:hypothetical protein